MDALDLSSPRREPAEECVIPVSRPGVDDAPSTTHRLFGDPPIAGPGAFNTADTIDLSPFTPFPNLDPQFAFGPVFLENGAGSMSFPASSQLGSGANAAWLPNNDVTGFGAWTETPSSSFDDNEAASRTAVLFNELSNAQTPGIDYDYHEFGAGDSHSSRPMISYNYNNESFLEETVGSSVNDNGVINIGFEFGSQSSEVTGLDSDSIYEASATQASVSDASTPVTSLDQPTRFRCDHCNQPFKLRKDLLRHENSEKHRRNTGNLLNVPAPVSVCKYVCRCGFRQSRKDDYKRHLLKCKKKHKHHNYACMCGHHLHDKDEHLQHISTCGRGRPGRPRNGTSR